MKRKGMRLLFLGDQSVGKTSLISTMMYDTQGQKVKKLNKVSLSPQRCIYSKDVFTYLIDTDTQSNINQQIHQADIILLVYDISKQQTITRLQTHWMPIISSIRSNVMYFVINEIQVPVILVGNMLDKKELEMNNHQSEYINVRNIIKGLVRKYRQVQMGFECSAYYERNVKKVLNGAQRAVLYPLAPLYDLNTKQLTPRFKQAITRIFRILDKDLDGKLTDNELRNLQERVFQTDLNGDDIKTIKEIILLQLNQYNEQCIKLSGFFALQKKCIEMLKIQVCWSILRYFNYNDNLQINPTTENFIYDENIGQSLELSPQVIGFLQRIYAFSISSKTQSQSAIQFMFSCAPNIPIEEFREENITLERFILAWMIYAFLDYKECYRSLLYIGYQDGLETVYKKVRGKKTFNDISKLKERRIFTVVIVENQHDQYQSYLQLLFKKSVTFTLENYLQRTAFLFNQDSKTSKILIMLKVQQRFLPEFFLKNNLKNKIDLVVILQNQNQDQQFKNFKTKSVDEIINFSKQNFPAHTMFRILSKKQCSKLFSGEKLPSLNLQSIPIQYKQQNWQALFSQLVKTFQKPQLGYSVQKLEKLKKQTQKLNKIWTGVGILSAAVLGFVALKKNPFS